MPPYCFGIMYGAFECKSCSICHSDSTYGYYGCSRFFINGCSVWGGSSAGLLWLKIPMMSYYAAGYVIAKSGAGGDIIV